MNDWGLRARFSAGNRVALAVGLVVLGLAGCAGEPDTSGDPQRDASPRPSPTLLSMPDGDPLDGTPVPIESGDYLIPSSAWSVADFTVSFPEGWTVQYGHVFAQHSNEEDDEFGFYAVVVDEIFADACRGDGGGLVDVGPSVQDLVEALLEQPGPQKSTPVNTTLGGYPATRIDLHTSNRLEKRDCFLGPGTGVQVWYSKPADKYFVLLPDAAASVYVLMVDGERQVFLTQTGDRTSSADRAELHDVLDTIRIQGSDQSPPPTGTAASGGPGFAEEVRRIVEQVPDWSIDDTQPLFGSTPCAGDWSSEADSMGGGSFDVSTNGVQGQVWHLRKSFRSSAHASAAVDALVENLESCTTVAWRGDKVGDTGAVLASSADGLVWVNHAGQELNMLEAATTDGPPPFDVQVAIADLLLSDMKR